MNLDMNSTKQEYLSDLSKIIKGAGINLGGMIGRNGLFFFYTIFLARVLEIGDLGLYFLGVTIVGFLAVLSNLGLNVGVTRFVAIYNSRKDFRRLKGTVQISAAITLLPSLITMCLIFLLGDLIATSIFHKPELGKVIKILSLSIPFDSLMWIFLAATRGLKFMQYTAYTQHFTWIGLRYLFAVLFVFGFGIKLKGAVLAYVMSSIISAGMAFYFANKLIPFFDKKVVPIFEVRNLLKFSIPMVFSTFLNNLNKQIDILMLGLFVTAAEVGIYGVAARLVVLALVVFRIFQPIFEPFVSYLHAKTEMETLSKMLKVITKWGVTMSFPIFLSLLCFPAFFLHFFGNKFMQGASCLIILAIAHILSAFSGLTSSVIYMSGRSDITFKNNLTALIANVILNYLLIPQYGILGAALATGISLVLIAFFVILESYYLMKLHPFSIDWWKPILAGLISSTLTLSLRTIIPAEGTDVNIALLFIFFLFYILLIYSFKLSSADLYVKSLIHKKLLFFIR